MKQSRQLISELSKQKNLERGRLMLRETERAASKILIWSDEKLFTVEAVANKQSKRFNARSSRDLLVDVRCHFRRQKPVWVMVWAAVASDGRQICFCLRWWRRESRQPSLFEHGVGKSFSLPHRIFCEQLRLQRERCFNSHSECDQEVIQGSFPRLLIWVKQLWPPLSPHINPMGFAVWSIVETDVSTCSHPKMDSLKAAIQSVWTKFNEEVVRRSCASVKACFKTHDQNLC